MYSIKKLFALVSVISLMFMASGCSTRKMNSESSSSVEGSTSALLNGGNNTDVIPENFRQTVFSEEKLDMPQNFWDFQAMKYIEDLNSYYILYNDMDFNLILRIYSADFMEYTEKLLLENNGNCQYFSCISDSGIITVFTAEKKTVGAVETADDYFMHSGYFYSLTQFGSDLKPSLTTELPDMDYYYSSRGSVPISLTEYSSESFLMTTNHELLLLDTDGSVTEISGTTGFVKTGVAYDGRAAFADYQTLNFIDELNHVSEDISLCGNTVDADLLSGDDEFILYIPCDGGIYGLSETNELTLIVDYAVSYLPIGFIERVERGSDRDFLIYVNENGRQYIASISPRPDDYSLEREKITLACAFMNEDDRILANEFNKSSDRYFLEVKQAQSLDDLKMDILTGNAPDIIKYNDMKMMEHLVNLGGVSEMYSFMEQYGGLEKNDILSNVISALEYNNGLYALSDKFEINFIVADKSFIGEDYTSWSFNNFLEIYNSRPSEMKLSYDYYTRSNEDIFRRFCSGQFSDNLSAWIDGDSCNFDSDEFIKLLELCRDAQVAPDDTPAIDTALSLKNGTGMISFVDCCRDVSQFQMLNVHQLGLDGLSYLSYPGTDSGGTTGFSEFYSICENAPCKEGAWKFISYIMSEEFQYSEEAPGTLYTLESAFEESLTLKTEREGVENSISEIGYDDFTFTCNYYLTEEEADIFRNLVNSCTAKDYNSDEISSICNEEFSSFINGEITAKQCADMIQNRVSIYLSEQS